MGVWRSFAIGGHTVIRIEYKTQLFFQDADVVHVNRAATLSKKRCFTEVNPKVKTDLTTVSSPNSILMIATKCFNISWQS